MFNNKKLKAKIDILEKELYYSQVEFEKINRNLKKIDLKIKALNEALDEAHAETLDSEDVKELFEERFSEMERVIEELKYAVKNTKAKRKGKTPDAEK